LSNLHLHPLRTRMMKHTPTPSPACARSWPHRKSPWRLAPLCFAAWCPIALTPETCHLHRKQLVCENGAPTVPLVTRQIVCVMGSVSRCMLHQLWADPHPGKHRMVPTLKSAWQPPSGSFDHAVKGQLEGQWDRRCVCARDRTAG